MNWGFVKVAAAVPSLKVGDCLYNTQQIESLTLQAAGKGVEIICFPELCITGYTCADLFHQDILLSETESCIMNLLNTTRSLDIITIIGAPIAHNGTLLNCALVLQKGKVLCIVPKTYLPNYKEFYEKRWFTSGKNHPDTQIRYCGQNVPMGLHQLVRTPQCTFGIEICEDLWATIPPSSNLVLKGAEVIFNLSATNESIGKNYYLRSLIAQQSARCLAGYVYSSCGFGESTTDLVFAGNGYIYENGSLIAESKRFCLNEQLIISEIDVEKLRTERRINTTFGENIRNCDDTENYNIITSESFISEDMTLTRTFDPHPFVPTGNKLDERCEEIFHIQCEGLAKRLHHINSKSAVIGISGGLDSTLALLVTVRTFDMLDLPRKGIVGITMPGFGTTDRTYNNAISLMKGLGITIREISIRESVTQHFKDIEHDINVHDITYENGQARERTQILMDVANQVNGIVVGTGDLSELALGWATYNGDHMSMYGVNTSIPKTLVRHLVKWVAMTEEDEITRTTLLDIVDTPISPELLPPTQDGQIAQITEDNVGPYELHDFFIYNFMRYGFRPAKIYVMAQRAFAGSYDDDTIKKWLRTFCWRFFSQQFKRSCLPDGPKVGSITLSPRGDWRMPSDASSALWIQECKEL
ncbi:MAG: NAD(+) synthase [Bacteroidaceae bacterium]|nr:NAD(+) synthase [Bacteroidaceae bacterium]